MSKVTMSRRGIRNTGADLFEDTVRQGPDGRAIGRPAWPVPALRDHLEEAPAWGGGVHTWCRCGCTGDKGQFQPAWQEADFQFVDE
jgi:hypothetical protein